MKEMTESPVLQCPVCGTTVDALGRPFSNVKSLHYHVGAHNRPKKADAPHAKRRRRTATKRSQMTLDVPRKLTVTTLRTDDGRFIAQDGDGGIYLVSRATVK